MKLVIFSDIHGNSFTLYKFIMQIESIEYDYAVFCGDIFGYYYNQKECINMLRKIKRLLWLKGNHDQYFLNIFNQDETEDKYIDAYGSSYKDIRCRYNNHYYRLIDRHEPKIEIDAEGLKIGIFHGTPDNCLYGRLYPDGVIVNPQCYNEYDIVVLGHTHCRMKRWCGSTLIINPGSIGQPRDGSQFGYAVLDTKTRDVVFCDIYDECDELYRQIEENDPELIKLREILERRKRI